jgi:hypothetical protein
LNFLNPLFLFGLAAAAIPIIIHLFTRRQPREVPFPSLEFLTEVNQSEIRRLRLKQWLLLLLRTLAIAAVALAMARPAVRGSVGMEGRAATSLVVLVDQSGSMGASAVGAGASAAEATAGGGGTLIAEARRVIEDLLATLGPADEVLLVLYDRTPRPVTPRPSSDLGRLRAATQALAPTAFTTDHAQALAHAGSALNQSRALNRELFWISDFQASGFPAPRAGGQGPAGQTSPARIEVPPGPWAEARVYLIPLEPRSRANAGLGDASLAPTENDFALAVTGLSFGAASGDRAVEVRDAENDAELGRGFLNLPERGEASALLPLGRLPERGGVARIPDDALPLDNTRVFATGRSGALRVLVREDGPPSALRLALEAGSPASGIAVAAVDAAGLVARVPETDALVLNDLERLGSAELQAVLDFYRGGGGLFLILGNRSDPQFWNGLLKEMGAGSLGAGQSAAPGGAWRLMRLAAGHPVLAGFPARPGEPLSSARFQAIRSFTPGSEARVLLEFDRAHPALIETPHGLVMAASLDPAASDFPVSGAFLPLLHQAVKVLGRGTAATSLAPGERYSAPAGTGIWRIEDDQGRVIPSELRSHHGATRLTSAPLERPGLYRVFQDGSARSTFAVNPDVREFDLTSVPERQLVAAFPNGRAQVLRPGTDLARRVREVRYGRELWSWFVIAALLLLAAESVLGRWGMAGRAPARVPAPA